MPAEEIPRYADAPVEDVLYISARTGQGCERLVARMEELAMAAKSTHTYRFPLSMSGMVNQLYQKAVVLNTEYGEDGVTVRATVDARVRGQLKDYQVDS